MKIVQLNVWMGKIEGRLERFFSETDADVICLQEVVNSDDATLHVSRLCFDTSRILKASGFKYYKYYPNWASKIGNGNFQMGNMILSRIPIVSTEQIFVYGEYTENSILVETPSNNIAVDVAKLENGVTIVTHHGFWRRDPMGDEESVKAFKEVGKVVEPLALEGPLVMCGDLNIVHESPAFRFLDFLKDLTFEHGITNTLGTMKKEIFEVPCDHILVNDEVKVKSFKVLPDEVSDHLALEAEVEF